jgi:hypothetical protein
MNMSILSKQRGVSLSGFLIVAAILIFIGMAGLKIIPAFMNDGRVKHIFVAIANDPEMQKATPRDIRMSYSNRATIDGLTVIQPDEITIAKDGERLVLSASYSVAIPLAGNASLLLEFSPSSDK